MFTGSTSTTGNKLTCWRFPLLFLSLLALLAGLWAGMVRLGWPWPALAVRLPAAHGPLMVSGFLGTLISLERAVALSQQRTGRRLVYLAPLLAGLGAMTLLVTFPAAIPRALSFLGAAGLVIIFVVIYRRQPTRDHLVMGLGAVSWLVGNGLWLAGQPVHQVAPWWAGFLVLTIAGERLELSRVLRLRRPIQNVFMGIVALFLAGLLLALVNLDLGLRAAGLAFFALGLWLLRYDLARRTIRRRQLTGYIAVCLLLGYGWLIISGLLWLVYGGQYSAGPVYDALLHTLFLGFVSSMIFGHAPIIFPAVIGRQIPYTPLFYLHLGFLHLSLVLRVAGDLFLWLPARRWGGLLNGAAILLFFLVTAGAALRGRRGNEKGGLPAA